MVRKIKAKQILQLRNQGLSRRAIESAQGMSRHSIRAVLAATERLGLGWDDVAELSEAAVYSMCQRQRPTIQRASTRCCSPAAACMRASSRSRAGRRWPRKSPGFPAPGGGEECAGARLLEWGTPPSMVGGWAECRLCGTRVCGGNGKVGTGDPECFRTNGEYCNSSRRLCDVVMRIAAGEIPSICEGEKRES